jgi:hypothetical protein
VQSFERLSVEPLADHQTPPRSVLYPQRVRIVERTNATLFAQDQWPSIFAVYGGAFTHGHSGAAVFDSSGDLIGLYINPYDVNARLSLAISN